MNLDALAEAHFAPYDPQFDDDTEAIQRDLDEQRTLSFVSHTIRNMFDELNETEIAICKENADSIGEFVTEYIEGL